MHTFGAFGSPKFSRTSGMRTPTQVRRVQDAVEAAQEGDMVEVLTQTDEVIGTLVGDQWADSSTSKDPKVKASSQRSQGGSIVDKLKSNQPANTSKVDQIDLTPAPTDDSGIPWGTLAVGALVAGGIAYTISRF